LIGVALVLLSWRNFQELMRASKTVDAIAMSQGERPTLTVTPLESVGPDAGAR